MTLVRSLVLFVCLYGWVCAQIQIEESSDIQTDSVDIFSAQESTKSPGLAMAASILIPGLGHQYLEKPRRSLMYYTLESALIVGLVFSISTSEKWFDDSRSFASTYAGIEGGADEFFWRNVGSFIESEEQNRIIELDRPETFDEKLIADNEQYRWISDSLQGEYQSLRETATRFRVVASFIAAGMILNRVVAFIDTRASTRNQGIRHSTLFISPSINLAKKRAGLTLSAEF